MLSIFSINFVQNISHSTKRWAWHKKVCVRLHLEYPLFLADFNEMWIFLTDFRIILIYQISWKSVQWSQVVPCAQIDRHNEAKCCFSQFCEHTYKSLVCVPVICWCEIAGVTNQTRGPHLENSLKIWTAFLPSLPMRYGRIL